MGARTVWVSLPPLDPGVRRALRVSRTSASELRARFRVSLLLALSYEGLHDVEVVLRRYEGWHSPRFGSGFVLDEKSRATGALRVAVAALLTDLSHLTMRLAAHGKLDVRGMRKRKRGRR